jgi:hypothetical protein
MSFRFIEDRRTDYPATILSNVLGVSPAGYRAWRARPESQRAAANPELVDNIKRVHCDTCGRCGSPRIHAELRGSGARGEPRSRRATDVPSCYQGHHGPATAGTHRRQPSRLPDRSEPARAELHRHRAEPDLARRHHLCRDGSGLALSDHRPGPLQPKDRRLGNVRSLARRPAVGDLTDGDFGTAAPGRASSTIPTGAFNASAEYRKVI